MRVALDDLVDVDFIHEYFDELEASLSLAKEVRLPAYDLPMLAAACVCLRVLASACAYLRLLVSNLPPRASNDLFDGIEWPLIASDGV